MLNMKLHGARRGQAGFTLIEALAAILMFSLGVLALVGLQATAVQLSGNAKMRADASLLAGRLIGQMWTGDRTPTILKGNYQTDGAAYKVWQTDVEAALPGAKDNPPTVVITDTGQVTITILWKAPNEPASEPVHQHVTVAQISN